MAHEDDIQVLPVAASSSEGLQRYSQTDGQEYNARTAARRNTPMKSLLSFLMLLLVGFTSSNLYAQWPPSGQFAPSEEQLKY